MLPLVLVVVVLAVAGSFAASRGGGRGPSRQAAAALGLRPRAGGAAALVRMFGLAILFAWRAATCFYPAPQHDRRWDRARARLGRMRKLWSALAAAIAVFELRWHVLAGPAAVVWPLAALLAGLPVLALWWPRHAGRVAAFVAPDASAKVADRVSARIERHRPEFVTDMLARMRHNRDKVRPFAVAMGAHLGIEPERAAAMVTIHPRWAKLDGGEVIGEQRFEDHWQGHDGDKAAVKHVWTSRLNVPMEPSWRLHERPMRVIFTRSATPPGVVALDTPLTTGVGNIKPGELVRTLMQIYDRGVYFLGLDPKRRPVTWEPGTEDAHLLVSALSRRGKTNVLLAIVAQHAAKGGEALVIDVKGIGWSCLKGVPGVTVLDDPRKLDEMWAAIEQFYLDMEDERDDQGGRSGRGLCGPAASGRRV